jgi:hypothetical protein
VCKTNVTGIPVLVSVFDVILRGIFHMLHYYFLFRVTAQIEELNVFGLNQNNTVPQIVSSKEHRTKALLDVLFETNPLDEACDQRVHVFSKPLKVIYDAETVNKVVDIFTTPRDVDLSE